MPVTLRFCFAKGTNFSNILIHYALPPFDTSEFVLGVEVVVLELDTAEEVVVESELMAVSLDVLSSEDTSELTLSSLSDVVDEVLASDVTGSLSSLN